KRVNRSLRNSRTRHSARPPCMRFSFHMEFLFLVLVFCQLPGCQMRITCLNLFAEVDWNAMPVQPYKLVHAKCIIVIALIGTLQSDSGGKHATMLVTACANNRYIRRRVSARGLQGVELNPLRG